MPEDLGSYHIPDGKPRTVAQVNFLSRLKEAEAKLKAAQEKARQEAAEKARREAEAKAAAEQKAKAAAAAAAEADRHAKREAAHQKAEQLEKKYHFKWYAAVLAGGLALGGALIGLYEILWDGPGPEPDPLVGGDQVPGMIEVVPQTPTLAPVTEGEVVPDRGIPPALESQ